MGRGIGPERGFQPINWPLFDLGNLAGRVAGQICEMRLQLGIGVCPYSKGRGKVVVGL